jgi:hypothetical protein
MIIIPIGIQCTVGKLRQELSNNEALPFDWMFSNPKFVFEMFELIFEQNMNTNDLVKNHFLLCDKRADYQHGEYYYSSENGFALYNSKYSVIFPHDNYNQETIEKYIRRFDRLKDMILNSKDKLYFVYASQSSLDKGNFKIDNNDVIKDVYFYLSRLYKLISKFRDNIEMIIFDSILDDKKEILDENIKLINLNRCDGWYNLFCQIISQHKNLFI